MHRSATCEAVKRRQADYLRQVTCGDLPRSGAMQTCPVVAKLCLCRTRTRTEQVGLGLRSVSGEAASLADGLL